MAEEGAHYRSYILRLWMTNSATTLVWRITLHDARTGERHSFSDMESVRAFVQEQMVDVLVRHRKPSTEEGC